MSMPSESHLIVKPLRNLGTTVSVLLVLQIVLMAWIVFALLNRINVVNRPRAGERVTLAEADTADNLVRVPSVVLVFALVLSAVVWLVWQYRAQGNAQTLTPFSRLRFTPRWAVGWWFIPIANAFMPFQTVRELWKASNGERDWEAQRTWPVIGWWWALWIGASLLNLTTPRSEGVRALEGILRSDKHLAVAFLFLIAAAALAIAIVRSVGRRQERGAALPPSTLPPPGSLLPPPPPASDLSAAR